MDTQTLENKFIIDEMWYNTTLWDSIRDKFPTISVLSCEQALRSLKGETNLYEMAFNYQLILITQSEIFLHYHTLQCPTAGLVVIQG
jgi:hypothetical protein